MKELDHQRTLGRHDYSMSQTIIDRAGCQIPLVRGQGSELGLTTVFSLREV